MKNLILGLGLFFAQIWLTFNGVEYFGKYNSPYLFFGVSLAIALYFFWLLLHKTTTENQVDIRVASSTRKSLGALWGLITVAVSYEEIRKLWVQYDTPRTYSDVLPQMEALYNRFQNGEFPYTPLDMGGWSPFPVYMPLHWLPVGLAHLFSMDTRWIGLVLMAIAAGIYGWCVTGCEF
ncbi:MAG: hypothetical protein ABIQ02_16775 [Saprospiraceae bacterium]